MKIWEKAKEQFPSLSRNDFIYETCPRQLGMKDIDSPECLREVYVDLDLCTQCWDREYKE